MDWVSVSGALNTTHCPATGEIVLVVPDVVVSQLTLTFIVTLSVAKSSPSGAKCSQQIKLEGLTRSIS